MIQIAVGQLDLYPVPLNNDCSSTVSIIFIFLHIVVRALNDTNHCFHQYQQNVALNLVSSACQPSACCVDGKHWPGWGEAEGMEVLVGWAIQAAPPCLGYPPAAFFCHPGFGSEVGQLSFVPFCMCSLRFHFGCIASIY